MGDDDGHGHSHGGLAGGWSRWLAHPGLRVILAVLALAAVATVVGVVALWPDGEGRRAIGERADSLGLASERFEATVSSVTEGPCSYSTDDDPALCRTVVVVPAEGPDEGALLVLGEYDLGQLGFAPPVDPGERIIIGYEPSTGFTFYADRDRRTTLLWLVGLFAVVVVASGRLRGALALAAMGLTIVVLVGFVAPSVLDGHDPVLVAVVASAAIAFVSLYLTHGFTPTTTVALVGTLAALGLTLGISWLFVELAGITGLATEEGLTLPIVADRIDLSGLVLGGAVIGALGALDDVTVTQVATVAELRHRNPGLGVAQLVASGVRVGREHIASTVNTLLLAYAGASMPLLLLFAVADQSLVMVANSEIVAVEIIRTLCGSIGLVAAVPLTTVLAATLVAGGEGDGGTGAESADRPPSWDDFAPRDGVE